VAYQPSTSSILATYSGDTALPEQIKYMRTPDQKTHIALYKDLNYFVLRNVSTDINAFATDFSSPHKVTMPVTGYQCVCFSVDYTGIYLLDLGGILYFYDITSDTLAVFRATGYGNITDCYLDNPINSLVFVSSSTASVTFYVYDLTTFAPTNALSISGMGKFVTDSNFRYYILDNNSNITLFKITSGQFCSRGTYTDRYLQVCSSCLPNCTSCFN
jgi:hypothetical protein